MKKNTIINIIIGPAIFLLCCLLLPSSIFETLSERAAIGTVVWLAFWWVTRPVDYTVTALLPIAVNAFFQIAPMQTVISTYFSETIILLFASSILSVSMETTGLDKRIAASCLGLIGDNLRIQLVFWFILSVVLSAVLPNAVVCATISPIAFSMLKFVGEGDIKNSKIGSRMLLYIAYAVGIGGLLSPLGGAMNLVAVDYLQQVTGEEFLYINWTIRFAPIVAVIILSNILFMLRDVKRGETLAKSQEYFKEEYKKMGKMSAGEKSTLALFTAATVLSFMRPVYQNIFPGLKPAYIFLCCAIIAFFINDKNKDRIIRWKSIQGKLVWELMFIFAGGLAAGALINESGAAATLGNLIAGMGLKGGIITVFVIIAFTLILSDVTSNTATAAIAIPIVISVAKGINMNPIPWIYIATIGVNLSYCLPTSIRAIPVGYGVEPGYMLKEGWKLSVMALILMTLVAYFLLKCWPAFSAV